MCVSQQVALARGPLVSPVAPRRIDNLEASPPTPELWGGHTTPIQPPVFQVPDRAAKHLISDETQSSAPLQP
jgi:hypothetical protein